MVKKKFDFKQMGKDHARVLLLECMKGTSEQIANQVEFVKWTAIEMLSSIGFNVAFDGKEMDTDEKMAFCNEVSEFVMDGINETYQAFKSGKVQFKAADIAENQ
jgi:hypothetical protein